MRLIDADELIKTYEKETGYTWNAKGILECPKCFIDDAPTVEVGYFSNCASCERVVKIRENRPQGEWIETDVLWEDNCGGGMGYDYGYYFKCSACGKKVVDKTNFCPNCGAAMQKEGKEE